MRWINNKKAIAMNMYAPFTAIWFSSLSTSSERFNSQTCYFNVTINIMIVNKSHREKMFRVVACVVIGLLLVSCTRRESVSQVAVLGALPML